MESMTFTSLERVVAKYRSDVNVLQSPAAQDALTSVESHLGRNLPHGLRAFLAANDGASLFRGALRVRSTSELAPASEEASQVILFADGPDEKRWAWAPDPTTGYVFGTWDGETLFPMHTTFAGWLAGTVAIIESKVRRETDQQAIRYEADGQDVVQRLGAAHRLLVSGRAEQAERLLRTITRDAPGWIQGWQYLGDALAAIDRNAARQAWLQAFRQTQFPLPWPGAPCIDPELLQSLALVFTQPEVWEKELLRFLTERVSDVTCAAEAEVVEAAGEALAKSLIRRGRRAEARSTLSDLLTRANSFTLEGTPWHLVLRLAALESDLGNHDEAEAWLRRIRREAPVDQQGPALLILAQIAITRQEPWAEEILNDAQRAGLDPADKVVRLCLGIERNIRQERYEDAQTLLERASAEARRLAIPQVTARVKLAEGDVHRVHARMQPAVDAYQAGLSASESTDAELAGRFLLRLGDVALATQQIDVANEYYRQAAALFDRHELPIREGWALLRLARTEAHFGHHTQPLLAKAHSCFVDADLACGVAGLDATLGDPGASLDWHLERATRHARARYNAQRARPPWERADAERPERRLGAHRLAISACSERVVDNIATVMERCARAIEVGRGRPLDPDVLRYVAAVDLLSGHRSFNAARLLLHHLLGSRIDGHAYRALQGAVARSPNAALVDGLLQCIELPDKHPGAAVAAAAELLGLRRERAAVRPLLNLLRHGNPRIRKASVSALGRIGDRQARDGIAEIMDEAALAEQAALALLMLGDRRGIDFHGRALIERRLDLSGHPGELVGRYGGPEHLLLLISAAEGDDACALGALQGLGLLGDPRGVPTLLKALSHRSTQVVEVASGALSLLTGHEESLEEPGYRNRWHTYWEAEGEGFVEGTRHREGKPYTPGFLVERMRHDDAWTRRTAYDELVITTGANLPFDAEGPWRVQQAHLAAWDAWWSANKARFIAGHWYLDGKAL